MAYLFTALIPLIALVIIVILAKRIAAHSFRCSHCGGIFRIRWQRVLITEHDGDTYLLTCPQCNTKTPCTKQPPQ